MEERLVKVEYETTEKKQTIMLKTDKSEEDLRNIYNYFLGGHLKQLTIKEVK